MTTQPEKHIALPTGKADRPSRAPRSADDKPWEHPADGGEPLDGHAMWTNDVPFGSFRDSAEFAADLAQALRRVFERMHRAGFRDFELEWDYVEASYWSLRRNLEIHAREAFRLWYGDAKWRKPLRAACRMQESGKVEYRIDHLLQSGLGVAVRKADRAKEISPPCPPLTIRKARHGELANALRTKVPTFMTPGEWWNLADVSARLRSMVEFNFVPFSVYQSLSKQRDLFDRRLLRSKKGQQKVHFSLRAAPGQRLPSAAPAAKTASTGSEPVKSALNRKIALNPYRIPNDHWRL
jgi:hypothetical protein